MSLPAPESARSREWNSGAAYFDTERSVWVLSAYEDVAAALRSPKLVRTDFRIRKRRTDPSLQTRSLLISSLTPERLMRHQAAFERITKRAFTLLPDHGVRDLIACLIQPWSLAISLEILDSGWASAPVHCFLARNAPGSLAATARASGFPGCMKTKASAWLLKRVFRGPAGMARRTIMLGLTQTLPAFLASAWLALLQNPEEMARLRSSPSLLPSAMEELLRHAGQVRNLYREAIAPCSIGAAEIAAGDYVALRIAFANRDAARFEDPIASMSVGAPGPILVSELGLIPAREAARFAFSL
jgi:cytochrome P450